MAEKIGLLNENNGQKSMTRVVFLLGSIWAMALTTFLAITGTEPGILIAVFGSLQGTYVALKLGQKPMEKTAK
jgi:hypothetical protein